MIILLRLVALVFFCYVAYCTLVFFVQRQVIYPRHVIPALPDRQKRADVEVIWLETSYGKVEAWFMKAAGKRGEPAPAVIFAHGNGELIDYWPDQLARFTELGVNVLLVEYPGYGRSAGTPSQKSITEAFVAAYDMLGAREEVDPHQIILLGRSLGGGAVSALAAERPTKALILMSTFTSVRSFAKNFYVPPFLIRDPFDNLSVVATYTAPLLIMHGRQDEVIPYEHAQTLYQAASSTRQTKLLTYDCGHNDCPPDWEAFWQEIERFLGEVEHGGIEQGLREIKGSEQGWGEIKGSEQGWPSSLWINVGSSAKSKLLTRSKTKTLTFRRALTAVTRTREWFSWLVSQLTRS